MGKAKVGEGMVMDVMRGHQGIVVVMCPVTSRPVGHNGTK